MLPRLPLLLLHEWLPLTV
ncbi:hypothetical protein YPPY89_3996, partial [Yersinia pestis PY-89]